MTQIMTNFIQYKLTNDYIKLDAPSTIDQDQVLEELLGKVKSNKSAEKSGINPFKTPESANINHHSATASHNKTPQMQNPFRKNTGIKRATPKQVSKEREAM